MTKLFYGNTVREWAIAFGTVIVAVLAAKLLYWILKKIAIKVTARSANKLDDTLLVKLEHPAITSVVLLGLWLAFNRLNIPEALLPHMTNAFKAANIFVMAWIIVRVLKSISEVIIEPRVSKSKSDLDDQLYPVLRKGVIIAIWTIASIVALNNAGYDVGALIAGLGVGGIAFALAAKDIIGNLFGGITIFTDKPFMIHDRIKVNGFDGTVEKIGIRSTRIRTLEGRLVILPNLLFTTEVVENVSSEPARKVNMLLGLVYETKANELKRAIDILKKIAEEDQCVLDNYSVNFDGFADSSVNLRFIYWIQSGEDYMAVQSQINSLILEQFNAEALSFAFPSRTVYHVGGADVLNENVISKEL